MKKILLALLMIITIDMYGDSYSDQYININVYKGWETLEENEYILEYAPHEKNYDFITEQEKYKNAKFDLNSFKEKFQDRYIPIVINIMQKKAFKESYESIYIDRIYTYNKSFIVKDMIGWEHSYNQTPAMIGAYYFPNVSIGNDYKIVFLMPLELDKEDISISFGTFQTFKKIMKIKKDNQSSYQTRLEVLKMEEERIKNLINKK